MPMKEQSVASPTRLPPAPTVAGSRQSTPSKSASPTTQPTSLSPLKLLTGAKKLPLTGTMPPPSTALVASRSPPLSPHGAREKAHDDDGDDDDDAALEAYALRIHRLLRRQPPSDKPTLVVSVKSANARRVVIVPKLGPTTNNNALDQHRPTKKTKSSTQHQSGNRHLNAGVYLLENLKTGHRFVGTTWDLRNAEVQSFADLRDGVHAHQALARSFQLYGAEASGIRFSVLERVSLSDDHDGLNLTTMSQRQPPRREPRAKRRRRPEVRAFDVRTMETLLRKRQAFHQRQLVRKCARQLVVRRLVRPFLARFWPVWVHNAIEKPHEMELLAAAVMVQSVARMFLSRRLVKRTRLQRAAQRITQFVAFAATKRVLFKRRQRRRRHESVTQIQRSVVQFLQRRRRQKRALLVKQWLSARHIQRVYRGYRGRLAAQTTRKTSQRSHAAVAIQAFVRGFLVRRQVHRQRQRFKLNGSAVVIQKHWRGFHTRHRVTAPLRVSHQFTTQQTHAASRLQRFFRRYYVASKLSRAAQQHALELHQVARIHAAYKNHLAKKFGWAALTVQLEQTSAIRIQRSVRRWFYFARIARLVQTQRYERAATTLQRVFRGLQGRRHASERRETVTRRNAAVRIQHTWRLCQALTKLHAAVLFWRMDKIARLIQKTYRGVRCCRAFVVLRIHMRRECASTKIQSLFRRHAAQRAWQRRLQLHRDDVACHECGDAVATMVSLRFGVELCSSCAGRWPSSSNDQDELMELALFREQQRLATSAQRVFRGFQARKRLCFGVCAFCEQRAVRVACRSCLCSSVDAQRRTFCRSCDAQFHRTLKHADRVGIEAFYRQHHAAVLLQKHMRRYAQRHTISTLRHRRHTVAATKIQTAYNSRRQRRHTRVLVATKHELVLRQRCGARVIQRHARGMLARRERQRLKMWRLSTVAIQRVFRGHCGRLDAQKRRQRRDAAICIQRHVRGVQGRRLAERRRFDAHRDGEQRAAVTVQRHIRGWLVRRRAWRARREAAALVLQSAWRRDRAKRVLRRLVRDRDERRRLEAQAIEQERISMQHEKERVAATRIQCLTRRWLARRQRTALRLALARQKRIEQLRIWLAVERKSAARIQRFVRRHWLAQASTASLQIQRGGRQWLARRTVGRLREVKRAAVCIQRAFRYSRAKRKLTRLVSLESFAVAESVVGWVELFDEDSSCVYYYNRETMAAQWVKPPELMGDAPGVIVDQQYENGYDDVEVTDEPPEWVEYWDDNVGASYFYNTFTGEATWAAPDGVAAAAASSSGSGNQWEEGSSAWAWPPAAPVDGKGKPGNQSKEEAAAATESNQSETIDPAAAETVYYDEQGNLYTYDYDYAAYAYDYSTNDPAAYVHGYDYSGAPVEPQAIPARAPQIQEGFDDSPVDTLYNLHYEIYMTQLRRDAERQQQQQQDQDQDQD